MLYKTAFPVYRPLYQLFKSYEDRVERRLLAQSLAAGSVLVDAGANIGIYSQFLANCVGPSGVVHSFEPSPENFARLRVALASFPNARLNQMAVSDQTGETVLYLSNDLNVDHRTYPTEGEQRKTVSIRSTKLDDYFKPGERVDLIKLDIQGYEVHALRGALRVLTENPNVKLLLEFWPYGLKQAGASGQALFDLLNDAGFSIFRAEENGLVQYDGAISNQSDPGHYFNLFARRE